MQDRFKFRVWDKKYNEMMAWESFKEEREPELNYNPPTNELWVEFDNSRFVLMQCTGIKEIHGKLIFEGDIVKVFHVSSTGQGRLDIRYVSYDEDKARFILCENDFMSYITVDTDDVYEVIGNIYENADLLRAEEC